MTRVNFSDFSISGLKTISDDRPDDLFISCTSYDHRSSEFLSNIGAIYQARFGLIYHHKDYLKKSKKFPLHYSNSKKCMDKVCKEVFVAKGNLVDPFAQLSSMRAKLEKIQQILIEEKKSEDNLFRITIDISGFGKETLFILLKLIKINFCNGYIRFVYTSPTDYGEWLSKGVQKIRNVIGFSGMQYPSARTILIILSGFEPTRVLKLIDEYEPSEVLLGMGDSSESDKFFERNQTEQKLILASQQISDFSFSVSDIWDCYSLLKSLTSKYSPKEYNLVIAPMSSKVSSISAFLLAQERKEIQVAYCVPGEYNYEDYSSGMKNVFVDCLKISDGVIMKNDKPL